MTNAKTLCVFFLLYTAHFLALADISQEIRQGANASSSNEGGFLDLGIGLGVAKIPIYGLPEGNRDSSSHQQEIAYINVNGRYQYKGFFVEAYAESIHDLNLGYNITEQQNWSFDLLISSTAPYTSEYLESKDWDQLDTRYGDLSAGVRANYYIDGYILQLRVLQDISDTHSGQNSSLFVGNSWQHRNWNFHYLLGATFHSERTLDYYFGVSKVEATRVENFTEYSPDSSLFGNMELTAELGLAYPVSENWVLRAGYRYSHLPSAILDSPLVVSDNFQILTTSISYVF